MKTIPLPLRIRQVAQNLGLGPAVQAARAAYEARLLAPRELCEVMLALRFGTWPDTDASPVQSTGQ